MWTVINGFDQTLNIPHDSISLDLAVNDNHVQSSAQLSVEDVGSQLSFAIGQEVIVWNEKTPPTKTISLRTVPSTPAHSLVLALSTWTTNGALGSLINNSSFPPVMTFSNQTYTGGNNYGLLSCTTPKGYIHPGQTYMLSVYVTIATPLTNAQAIVKLDFLDLSGNAIGGASVTTYFSTTTNNALQQISVSGIAPAGSYLATASMGGQATVSGTNSGTITFGATQLEPMWFTAEGVSYPTSDINDAQANCSRMPDGTVSRTARLFSGYISDFQVTYDGPQRTWQLTCAGPAALLEDGLINGVYTSQYDTQIITSVITTYFSGRIAINAPSTLTPAPLVQGELIDSVSYNDNSLKDVLNGLVDQSSFQYFIDQYYRLNYQPAYYNAALFQLTDGTPDYISLFNYYDYQLEEDGTQLKRRIKITGGQFHGTYQDTFSGDGSTKQFTLTYIPQAVASLTVGGTSQRVGVYGRDSFASGHFDVLLNKQNQYILFNTAPGSGTNNVLCTYSYQAPITTQTSMQTSAVVTPAYALPYFDAKVNDTNLVSLNAATARGLAEIVKYGNPLQILRLKSDQFTSAGTIIYVTSSLDGITNAPFVVQTVKGTYLGGGINRFEYQLGGYQPSLIDHVRNANKALNRSTTVANVTAIEQYDVVALEQTSYFDSISAAVQTNYATSVYGTGHYGTNAYGGQTGVYGTATYGQSTIYG